jgi:hypothetical protein
LSSEALLDSFVTGLSQTPMRERILRVALAPSFLIWLAAINTGVFLLSVTVPENPHPFLDEWGPVSLLSGFQLLVCGLLALEIYKSRPAWIWRLMGWGFFFLCADEMLQLHESGDQLIHWMLGITPTRFTDHLDDVLIGLCGVAGLAALIAGRAEIFVFRRHWWLFAGGFVGFAVMVAFDLTAKDLGPLYSYFDIPSRQGALWAEVVEEGFKIAGGFCLVVALRRCWEQIKAPTSRRGLIGGAVPA